MSENPAVKVSLLNMDPGLDSAGYGEDRSSSGGVTVVSQIRFHQPAWPMLRLFFLLVTTILRVLRAAGRSRSELVLENIALRQQVGVLKQKRPRPRLDDVDRAFWVAMRVAWRGSGETARHRRAGYRGEVASRALSALLD